MRPLDLFGLVSLAAIWGSSYLFLRLGAGEFGAAALAGMRAVIAASILLPLMLWRVGAADLRANWKPVLVIGITNAALPYLLFGFAAMTLSAGMSAVLNASTPLFAATIAWVWLRDRPTPLRVAGLVIGFAGVSWLVWDKAVVKPGADGAAAAWAVAACLLAGLLYGFSGNFAKRRLQGVPPLAVAAGGQLVAAVLLVVPGLLEWPPIAPSAQAWTAVIVLSIVCTAFAYVLLYWLIARTGAPRTMTVSFLIPVFGVVWGAAFLHEEFTREMALGCAVVLLGTALTTGLLRMPRRNAAEA